MLVIFASPHLLAYTYPMYSKRGFTLVELAVVLVIIGLLVGGVLVAQSLIRAGELLSVASDFKRYQLGIATFQLKYKALPGDMSDAFMYWGAEAGCTNVAVTSGGPGCNGNGDGRWQWWQSEGMRAWQFLGLTGMIEGGYTGVAVALTAVPGVNIPAGRIENSGYYLHYTAIYSGASVRGNAINIGAVIPADNANGPLFTPEEAYDLDTKFDDGRPERGKFHAHGGIISGVPSTLCFTGTSPDTIYELTVSSRECRSSWFQ